MILPIAGFLVTLLFELAPNGVYGQWFLFNSPVYPDDPVQWGEMAGKGMSLQHYLNGLGNHIQVSCLAWFIFLNAKEKEPWLVISALFTLSLINYICNNHNPIIWSLDMNYFIATFLVYLTYSKWRDLWK